MLFVKAYPTFVCYLLQLQLKQPNKDIKPKRQIPEDRCQRNMSDEKTLFDYNILDFPLTQEHPTV